MRDRGPYPILAIQGEQGSGKSIFSRLVRSVIDPNQAPIRAAPKDERDLVITAGNMHVITLDNLSSISPTLADSLCRMATGSGFATRMLHTDRGESIFSLSKPIMFNGIPHLTERPDLAERAITIRLRSIPEEGRQPEEEFWADWENVRPRVLGALCDALSCALRRINDVKLGSYPRMADFAKWATAAEAGFGWEDGTFIATYDANRKDVNEATFEADSVAIAIHALMQTEACRQGWKGTASELLAALNEQVPEALQRSPAWPRTPQGFGNRLERIMPLLRRKGYAITKHHSGQRYIEIMPADAMPIAA